MYVHRTELDKTELQKHIVHCAGPGASMRNGSPPGCSMYEHCDCPVLIHSLHTQIEMHN